MLPPWPFSSLAVLWVHGWMLTCDWPPCPQYVAYVSAAVLGLGQMVTIMTGLPVAWEPIWWAGFYVTAL